MTLYRTAAMVAMVLGSAAVTRGEFIVQTHPDGTFGGNVASSTALPNTGSITVGGVAIPITAGGQVVTTTAGANVYFLASNTVSIGNVASSALSIYVTVPAGESAGETVTFTDDVDLFVGFNEFEARIGGSIAINPTTGVASITLAPPNPPGSILATPLLLLVFSNEFATNPPVNGSQGGGVFVTITGQSTVPEPASLALMGVGLVVAGMGYRRRR